MRTTNSLLCSLLALGAVALAAPPALAGPKPERSPIEVETESQHSLAVANIVFLDGDSAVVGGALGEMRLRLVDELRKRGYNALGGEDLVFGKDKSDDARFLLGGTVSEHRCEGDSAVVDKDDGKTRFRLRNGKAKVDCAITTRWELFDRKLDAVVYEVTTRQGETDFTFVDGEKPKMTEALLVNSLRSVLERKAFIAALTKKADSEKPGTGGSAGPKLTPLSFRQCDIKPASLPDNAEQSLDATVMVEVNDGGGSGFFLSRDGLILTAAHVATEDTAKVTYRDGSVREATVLRRSEDKDVALLLIDGAATTCLPISLDEPAAGTEVFAIGSPALKELAFSLTRGIVSGTREIGGSRYIQTDASVSPGNSGGPLIEADGRATAIVAWKIVHGTVEGISFGVPIHVALDALGLTAGTSTDLRMVRERPEPVTPKADLRFVDKPDPAVILDVERHEEREEDKRDQAVRDATSGWVYVMRYAGYGLAGLGAVTVAGSYVASPSDEWGSSDDRPTYDSYQSARLWNDVGWGMLGVGLGAAITSYFLESEPNETAAESKGTAGVEKGPTVTTDIGLTSVRMTVRY